MSLVTGADTPQFEPSTAAPLDTAFFARETSQVARDLLGCVLASTSGGRLTAGVIIETEAYLGSDDPGSHAATRGMTKRNEVMYRAPGTVYVYFTYGNHHMLNLVCEPAGVAGAVLIRALEPLAGIEVMQSRRAGRPLRELCSGPGRLAQALGIDLVDNGSLLGEGRLQVYDCLHHEERKVAVTGRIGLSQGHELPLRFHLEAHPLVSRGRTGPRPAGRHGSGGEGSKA